MWQFSSPEAMPPTSCAEQTVSEGESSSSSRGRGGGVAPGWPARRPAPAGHIPRRSSPPHPELLYLTAHIRLQIR
ncbi:hypothetical protein E2C01_065430 [Portunus trituberculatus]|uniref:Uncharacterized protein n=1 Tax=Portunus trituberculatus TaxID=210409 RepID=A0A5B7HFL2_PORTR|nr:hypothetical protein [Portunus trituberculatus]